MGSETRTGRPSLRAYSPAAATSFPSVRVGGLCWVATTEIFAAEQIAKSAWPSYSLGRDEISFLGVTYCGPLHDPLSAKIVHVCSPLHAVMNAGFVALGPLVLLGIALTWSAWPRGGLSTLGLLLLGIGAIGTLMIGLWPVNASAVLHAAGALIFFSAGGLGTLVLALSLRRAWGLKLFGLGCALLSLWAFGAELLNHIFLFGRGGMERMAAYPLSLWVIALGLLFLLRGQKAMRS